jgi:hypothetical protein
MYALTGGGDESRLCRQKVHLFLSHLYLLPWFARRFMGCELPLRPFLDANPSLELGGLPIAPKHTRYGDEPPYLPSLMIDEATDGSSITEFAADHSFPLVLKPLFGAHSRGVRKLVDREELRGISVEEPMILQPYVDAPKEYGINVLRIGPRIKIYGLTEITLQAVWGDGSRSLRALVRDAHGDDVADRLDDGEWVPDDGCRVPLQTAADVQAGSSFRDITDEVTPALRETCQDAADQIDLRFGRFDVKAQSLTALKDGDFHVMEVNGSPSLDLTLYDDTHSLSVKIERLRAHWNQFFQQARPCCSCDQNSWWLLSHLLWFILSPKECAISSWDEVDDGELASRT